MTFKLDTSGVIEWRPTFERQAMVWTWSDLSPFTQGYFTEQARTLWESLDADVREAMERGGFSLAFSDWSPEALVLILEDCADHEKAYPLMAHDPRRRGRGRNFWRNRQAGMWTNDGWPPQAPYLGDDGKVYLRAAA